VSVCLAKKTVKSRRNECTPLAPREEGSARKFTVSRPLESNFPKYCGPPFVTGNLYTVQLLNKPSLCGARCVDHFC